MSYDPAPQNLGIAYLVRSRCPGLSDRQLSAAVKRIDQRDTIGAKSIERDRSRWSALPPAHPAPAAPAALADDSAERCATVESALAACGLSQLVPHLRAGHNLRAACDATGTIYSTAARKVAGLRDRLRNE